MDRVPGADTLGFGFDITKKYDESSTTQRIFKEGADGATMTIGKVTYVVPQNIGTEPIQKTDATSQVFSTRQQVQDHFSVKAGVTGSGFGFTGHVEASYSHIQKHDRSYYYALVDASNYAYNLKLKEQGSEWYTTDFASDVKELPNAFTKENQDTFFAFFSAYGTHVVHQVQLGGSLYYYVAVEKTNSSDEQSVKAKMDLEYEGVFATTKADAESKWKRLGQEWASSRVVRMVTRGGENTLDGVMPGFNTWKGDAFRAWTQSLIDKPGLSGFNLTSIHRIVPMAKRNAVEKAMREYLRGGLIVKADRDFTPQAARRAYTAYPTIEGPLGLVPPPSPMPDPPRRDEDVAGIQVVLFDPETYKVVFNKDYYLPADDSLAADRTYTALANDLRRFQDGENFCAFSVFGLSPLYYPPAQVSAFLGRCGAKLIEWQKYIGATGAAMGRICYTLAGRQGGGIGAKEEFVLDPQRNLKKINATSPYFFRGAGVLLMKAES